LATDGKQGALRVAAATRLTHVLPHTDWQQAIAKGANAVDNYKYVQKGSVWSFSSTRWVMTGRLLQAEE
jgi:hypothetical protein